VVNFIINLVVSFLFPIELYSLRPSITFIISVALFTGEPVLHHVIRPWWKKNDNYDNDYDHHHHRDDNGGNNVTTGTVPVLDRSPASSSYNSRICCSVCGRYQGWSSCFQSYCCFSTSSISRFVADLQCCYSSSIYSVRAGATRVDALLYKCCNCSSICWS